MKWKATEKAIISKIDRVGTGKAGGIGILGIIVALIA